jgi:2-keto-4-pentenoate hydratase/2-oxohepta-3-ene-1,7-dioic acid hydratase in catechol pathway
MRIVRFETEGRAEYGVLENGEVRVLAVSPFDPGLADSRAFPLTGECRSVDAVRLLAPCEPSKYIGIGLNYRATAEGLDLPVPQSPVLFLKPSTAVIGPDQDIVLPQTMSKAISEGELAVVIGRRCKDIAESDVVSHILGYTITNDVMDVSQFRSDSGNPTRSKAHDTFGPLGPCIATGLDAQDLAISASVNGRQVQSGNVRDMIFGIRYCISYISRLMTLLPGDVIATGAPPMPTEVGPGDLVEISIENIGVLRNRVAAAL